MSIHETQSQLIKLNTQSGGAVYLAYNELTGSDDDSKICDIHDFGWLSWMAFAFCGFISLTLNEKLSEISEQGCYKFKRNLPPFFNKFWLSTGIFINIFVLIVSWIVSVIVIFLATSPVKNISKYIFVDITDSIHIINQ